MAAMEPLVRPPASSEREPLCPETLVAEFGRHSPPARQALAGLLAQRFGTAPSDADDEQTTSALRAYFAAVAASVGRHALARYCAAPDVDMLDAWFDGADGSGDDPAAGVSERVAAYDLPAEPSGGDFFAELYRDLFPREVRHRLGEFYTPDWLVEHVLDRAGYSGDPDVRIIDPTCGSGAFLVAAIRRAREHGAASRSGIDRQPAGEQAERDGDLCRRILRNVVGLDVNPLAVLAARANCALALGPLLRGVERVEPPVFAWDAVFDRPAGGDGVEGRVDAAAERRRSPLGSFDLVVGNPPWIAWDNLPAGCREATVPLWRRYGLFSLSANQARHGGGKKDLAMLVLYAAADRWLRHGGRLAMVVTQTLFQTKGAGDGFRRFQLGPDGAPLGVLHVDDLVAVRPFRDADNWTAVVLLEKGVATRYPVPYDRWDRSGRRGVETFQATAMEARPVDPRRPSSPWLVLPAGLSERLRAMLGPSDYRAYLGANSGGANGVFWVEPLGRVGDAVRVRNLAERVGHGAEGVEALVEPDLLYPLVRWGDVDRFAARPTACLLLVQDPASRRGIPEEAMRRLYPRTHAYLARFEPLLRRRAAFRRYQAAEAFYSMYNVGPYTLSGVKVVWRRMDRAIRAAVVEPHDHPLLGRRPVVPQETCAFIPCASADEAHYLAAVLQSAPVHCVVAGHNVRGGKGFGTPGMLDFVAVPRFDPADATHGALAAGSREAHRLRADDAVPPQALGDLRRRIDELAASLWGLSAETLAKIHEYQPGY
jgi:hypothetical protein